MSILRVHAHSYKDTSHTYVTKNARNVPHVLIDMNLLVLFSFSDTRQLSRRVCSIGASCLLIHSVVIIIPTRETKFVRLCNVNLKRNSAISFGVEITGQTDGHYVSHSPPVRSTQSVRPQRNFVQDNAGKDLECKRQVINHGPCGSRLGQSFPKGTLRPKRRKAFS
jgi:hypothetical protein